EQLVEQMGAADRSALVGAGWAAAGLPAPAECTDVAALTRQVDWTAVSPELAADLAAASAALALEAWNESLARSDSALVLAEAVGGRAEQARAHQLRADALFGLGDSRAAQQAHLAAFENAYLAGALKIAFHSAIALALLERDLRNDHLQARSWTSLASALLEQAGVAKETLPWAEAARAQAVLEATHVNVAAAREEFTRALRIRESVLGPRHPLALESRAHLASVSLRDGDPNAALEQYADLESAFEDAFGRGHPRFAWLLQNMAGAHSRVGSGRAAIAAYRQAVDILERTYGPRHPATLVAKSQLGTEYVAENDADEAHPLLQDAVEAANEILPAGDRRTVEAMVALAGVHHLRGEASLAEQWLSRASETLKPDPANQALASTILANRGLIANEDGRPTEARQLLERALAVAGAAKAEPLLLGQVRITLADIEREDELFASALSHYEAGLALFESVNAAGLLQARAHFGVAQMLDALGLDATRVAEQRQLALQAIDGVRGSFADEVRHNIAEAMRKAEQEGGQATVNAESGPGRPESGG
ncbi:MAG: tetratricopeptide repeat protein, partial [Myxococcota bacterium]